MQVLPRATRNGPLGYCHGSSHAAQIISAPRRRLRKQALCSAMQTEPKVEDSISKAASGVAASAALGLLSPLLLDVHSASAHDVLLQGRTVSLVHPALMFFLFGSTLWTGWLGLQWRCDACLIDAR